MPSGNPTSKLIGAWGEERAAAYLKKHGFKILAMNYHCRFGEIDLIASKKDVLCFVEVKTRKSSSFAMAVEFVDRIKQEKLRKTAAMWLSEYDVELQPRFDVIEVYAPEGIATKSPAVRHWEDAFE